MRILFLVSLCLIVHCGYSQSSKSISLTKEYNGLSFSQFVEDIEKDYSVRFFYDTAWITDLYIHQNTINARLTDVLSVVLSSIDLDFVILYDKFFVLVNKLNTDHSGITYIVSGYVRNGETGEALEGASVYCTQIERTFVTDKNGFFSAEVPKGVNQFLFNSVNLLPAYQNIRVIKNTSISVEMFSNITELEEVEISASVIPIANTLTLGSHVVSSEMIKTIPPLFGEVDVVRSLLSLPGVKSVGEGASGLNVRGGNADQNLFLVDNAPLYNTSHLFGLFSIVNADVVNNVTLYKGSIPAKYSGRLSSVMDVNIADDLNKPTSFSASLGAISSKVKFSSPVIKNKTAFYVAARAAYPNWVLHLAPNKKLRDSRASFYDFISKISHKISSADQLSVTMLYSSDDFRLGSDSTYSWSNVLGSIQWAHTFSEKANSHLTISYSKGLSGATASNLANGFTYSSSIDTRGIKYDVDISLSSTHLFTVGVGTDLHTIGRGSLKAHGISSVLEPKELPSEKGLELGIHISDEAIISSKLTALIGLRISHFAIFGPSAIRLYQPGLPKREDTVTGLEYFSKNEIGKQYTRIEPRASLKYQVNTHSTVKLGFNRNYQYLNLLSNTTSISPTDTWKLSDSYLKPQQGDQLTLGYFRSFFNDQFEISSELYYKYYKTLTQYKEGAQLILNEHVETDLIQGIGKAFGLEVYFRKNYGKITGTIGYTYSRSLVKVKGYFEDETISGGEYFPNNFDKPHDINVVFNYGLSKKTSLSSNFSYSTGRPITYPESVYVVDGFVVANYDKINQERIPNYHRLDFSLNHKMLPKRNRKFETSWSLGAYNVYARKNPFSVFFSAEHSGKNPQAYRLSVLGTIIPYFSFNFKITEG